MFQKCALSHKVYLIPVPSNGSEKHSIFCRLQQGQYTFQTRRGQVHMHEGGLAVFRWDILLHFLYQDENLFFLKAAWTTLWIAVIAQALGVFLGLFLALMRMSRNSFISWIARA